MSQSNTTSLKLPTIDITNNSQQNNLSALTSLTQACKEWGFFHINNHGISQELYNLMSSFAKDMFNLPIDMKMKLGPSSSMKNYTPHFIASPYYEGLRVLGPDFVSSAESSGKILLGPKSSEFSKVVQEYGNRMTDLSKKVVQIILKTLRENFDNKYYESEFSKCYGYLRIIQYKSPDLSLNDEVEGLGKHTDMCCLTILYSDDVSSLQLRSRQGQWMNIEPSEGTLLVNIGDMLEAWSNGKFRSSEHRVMLKKQRNRLCLAFFWSFEDDKVIFAPQDVVGVGNRRIFKPFVCLDYVRFREFDDKEKYEKVGTTVRDFAGVVVEQV